MNDQEKLGDLAMQAYIYGYPLVADLEKVSVYSSKVAATGRPPFNNFDHARKLAGPSDEFVSINNDTLYSIAQIDLSVGPVLLELPDAGDRYYVMQFVDAWTNNFAYVGKRATGTGPQKYILTPPAFEGQIPADYVQITFPTRIASIVGRWACNGEADIPNVAALQDKVVLKQLNPSAKPLGLPVCDLDVPSELEWFERMRVYMNEFPSAPRYAQLEATFEVLGLTQGGATSPLRSVSAEISDAFLSALKRAPEKIRMLLAESAEAAIIKNGWQINAHIFDYNADYFEIGTINSPQWIVSDLQKAIVMRMLAAFAGLWGNHAYEALYPMVYVDSEGDTLNGAHEYTLTLDPVPEVGAFWSITMYSEPHYYLVENPIARYSIGDRTPQIEYNEDKSLTITISRNEPADEKAKRNWLPAPEGDFRPIFRLYIPSESLMDATYPYPGIEKVG